MSITYSITTQNHIEYSTTNKNVTVKVKMEDDFVTQDDDADEPEYKDETMTIERLVKRYFSRDKGRFPNVEIQKVSETYYKITGVKNVNGAKQISNQGKRQKLNFAPTLRVRFT